MPALKIRSKNLRFDISLVILVGVLAFSLHLLLLTLNRISIEDSDAKVSRKTTQNGSNFQPAEKSAGCALSDESVDFNLTMPAQIGDWVYKTGYVKSPTDENLSDQYVQVFIPVPGFENSKNFERQNANILTIRRFSQKEWSELEKGCQKENQLYCEAAGKAIAENNGTMYAYTKPANCPKSVEAKCALAEKIIESFKLK